MTTRVSRSFGVALIVSVAASLTVDAQKPTVEGVLQSAADYLVKYSEALSVVAAEEQFVQYDTSSGNMGTPVRLTGDVVLFGNGMGQARTYRDLAAIDNKPVRPRDDRLLTVMKGQDSARIDRATKMTEASAQRYVSQDLHGLDDPFLALEFLRKENQGRSTFKLDGIKNMNGVQVVVVKFSEQNTPRLVPSPEDAPAVGKFWIEVGTGVVRQTEFSISGRASNFHASVKYARDASLDLWLPSELDQDCHATAAGTGMSNMGGGGGFGAHGAAEGHATYSKYRR